MCHSLSINSANTARVTAAAGDFVLKFATRKIMTSVCHVVLEQTKRCTSLAEFRAGSAET